MNNTITGCTILFESGLSEKTKDVLITAIKRFAGVEGLSVQYDSITPQEPVTSPAVSLTAEEHRRIPMPDVLPPKMKPKNQENKAPKPANIQIGNNYIQQRSLIDFAIKWGITTKRVDWEAMRNLSPEQIVEKAFTLIKEMPDTEIKKIEAYL